MLFNILEADKNPSGVISYFRGLNRRYKGNPGEFRDMTNMSSSGYPCMIPRAGRRYLDDDGIKNKRLVIPPINKDKDKDIPGFTGIAGTDFYYEGGKIQIGKNNTGGEFSQGYKQVYEYRFQPMAYDGLQYLDVSEPFPEGRGTELSYCYMNNRLFIFVSNDIGLRELGYKEDYVRFSASDISEYVPTSDGTFENLYGNVITISDAELAKAADGIKGRNIELVCDETTNPFSVKYYVTDVRVTASTVIITLNEPINANPFAERGNAKAVSFKLYLYKDAGKYYYDAGKSGRQTLHNMEKGFCNIACNITAEDYTDEVLGIQYTDTDAIACDGGGRSTVLDFGTLFNAGDFIKVYGCYYESNDTIIPDSSYETEGSRAVVSCHIVGIRKEPNGGSVMYVQCLNENGECVHMTEEQGFRQFGTGDNPYVTTYCITKIVPNMSSVTSHNQRLWGVNKNGEYFYASAAGDPFTWMRWEDAGESDPFEVETGTKDEYTGIIEYGQYVLLLKPTSIQQVYALASTSTVQIARAIYNVGCIDIQSALVIGGTAYYLGYNGFYRYTGAEPELISDSLNTRYVSACAVTDGVKYYASAKRDDGGTELVVYDTRYGFWHKEDATAVLGSYMWYDKPVVVTKSGETYVMNSADADIRNGKSIPIQWSADSVAIYEDTFSDKTVNAIWLRAYIPKGETITVYTNVNGGKWIRHETFTGEDRVKIYRTPVRAVGAEEYRFRIEGTGQCVIYELERVMSVNGKNHNAARERRM